MIDQHFWENQCPHGMFGRQQTSFDRFDGTEKTMFSLRILSQQSDRRTPIGHL